MTRTSPALTVLSMAAGCLAGGLGWRAAEPPAPVPEHQSAATRVQTPSQASKSRVPASVAKALEKIRQAQGPAARQQATIDLTRSLSADELLAWLKSRWFTFHDGGEFVIFNEMVMQRLAEENPQALMKYAESGSNDQYAHLMVLCAAHAPDLAMDWFHAHPNEELETKTWLELAPDFPDIAMKGLLDLGGRAGAWPSDRGSELLLTLAEKRGPTLRDSIGKLREMLQSDARTALDAADLLADFHGGIGKLAEQPDGLDKFRDLLHFSPRIVNSLPDEIATLPEAWREELTPSQLVTDANCRRWVGIDLEAMGYSAGFAGEIQNLTVKSLMYQDPELALGMLDKAGLSPSEREDVLNRALFGLTGGAEKLDEWKAHFTTQADQNAVDQLWNDLRERTKACSEEEPELAAQGWIKRVVDYSGEKGEEDMGSILTKMTPQQLAGVQADFRALPDDSPEKGRAAKEIAAAMRYTHSASAAQGDAIRYLVTRDLARDAGSQYVVDLVDRDPAAAVAWVDGLPESRGKREAQKQMAAFWREYDPEAMEEWLKTLPAPAQQGIRDSSKSDGD